MNRDESSSGAEKPIISSLSCGTGSDDESWLMRSIGSISESSSEAPRPGSRGFQPLFIIGSGYDMSVSKSKLKSVAAPWKSTSEAI